MRRRRPRAPRPAALLAVLAVLAALTGGWLWLRDASLFAVERVTVHGATGPDAPAVRAALTAAARRMTTLHVEGDTLRDAVARNEAVAGVRVDRDLPHGLRIEVVERPAVATVMVNGRRAPLAPDGEVLDGATPAPDLPALSGDGRHRTRLVELLAAAPGPLRRRARRAYVGATGLTLAMREGPTLRFGRGDRLEAKWAAAGRVLADPASSGARYVDLRVPERPAAGGLVASTSASGSTAVVDPPAQVEVQG
jgi:cell division protein FtsQ